MSLISWIWNITTRGYGFDCQRTSFYGDLSIYLQRQQLPNWFFSSFHSTICSPGLTIPRSKNWALSESVYFLILNPTNICQICYFLSSQGALNTSLWRAIFENINMGKIGNILTLQLWYHSWIRHHLNWIEIKTSYYPKILLNGNLQ